MKKFIKVFLISILSALLLAVTVFAADTPAFSNIKGDEYYAEGANWLLSSGIFGGNEDGTFDAEATMTRAEMSAIICRIISDDAAAAKAVGKTPFSDVPATHKASGYINILFAYGVIDGDGNGKFRPDEPIKYEEAVKMTVCAVDKEKSFSLDPKDWSKVFLDFGSKIGITDGTKGSKGALAMQGDIALMAYKLQYLINKFSEGLLYSLISDDSAYRVDGIGECKDTVIRIPNEYNKLPVTEIGEKAFFENDTIVSVKIPNTVVTIGDKAFSGCTELKNVTMPDYVTLGTDVFRESINVILDIQHEIVFVEEVPATCETAGVAAHYVCENCGFYYKDSAGIERIYDIVISPSHDFKDGVCSKCGKILDSVRIVEVDTITHLGKFALGTLDTSIGLPQKINVKTADGASHSLDVIWNTANYDKSKVGNYTITGHIQAGKLVFDTSLSGNVTAEVEIVDFMKGTADIVFVLDTSGSMGNEIDTVKRNLVSFAKAVEEKGVSARWSVITYSDFTLGNANEQTKIIYKGADAWFTSAAECADAINGISLANGGDTPEVAIDGLMAAKTLENRKDARVFYILVTDATFKTDNHYSVKNMTECTNILKTAKVNVSVVTDSYVYSDYSAIVTATGGILENINGNFAQKLLDSLVPIIYAGVIA